MKKTLMTITAAAMALGSAQAVQIFMDDFESYTAANPAGDQLQGGLLDQLPFDPSSTTWTPGNNVAGGHRIFGTALYGVTQLWITNIDGSSLTTSGIALENDMTYTLDFFAGSETNTVGRKLNGSVDILVGQDIGTATSVLGGPQIFVTDADQAIDNASKLDQMFQQSFDSGTINPGDQMFVTFTRVSVNSGSGAWFAIDDVSIDQSPTVPEPSSTALLGLGALGCLLRRKR